VVIAAYLPAVKLFERQIVAPRRLHTMVACPAGHLLRTDSHARQPRRGPSPVAGHPHSPLDSVASQLSLALFGDRSVLVVPGCHLPALAAEQHDRLPTPPVVKTGTNAKQSTGDVAQTRWASAYGGL
jgi:hypothetical protein